MLSFIKLNMSWLIRYGLYHYYHYNVRLWQNNKTSIRAKLFLLCKFIFCQTPKRCLEVGKVVWRDVIIWICGSFKEYRPKYYYYSVSTDRFWLLKIGEANLSMDWSFKFNAPSPGTTCSCRSLFTDLIWLSKALIFKKHHQLKADELWKLWLSFLIQRLGIIIALVTNTHSYLTDWIAKTSKTCYYLRF